MPRAMAQTATLPNARFAPGPLGDGQFGDGSLRRVRRLLSPAWPIYALFLGFPLWWVMGLSPFIWAVFGLALVPTLITRRRLIVPRHFGVWLLFLIWVLASATQLDWGDPGSAFTYLWRFSLYVGATALFVYVLNFPHELPTRNVLYMLVIFFGFIVVLGYVAILAPQGQFTSLIERVLPAGFRNNEYVLSLVHPYFAQIQDVLGYPFPRPTAPFQYSNQWGSTFTLLLPMVFVAIRTMRTGFWRNATVGLLAASIVPFVVSVNRGATLTLAFAMIYALWRFGRRGNVKAIAGAFAILALVAVIVIFSPLGQIVGDRISNQSGTTRGRSIIYAEASERIWDSPILGYGVPLPRPPGTLLPPVGTHGQFWIVMIPTGIPGVIFFFAWFLYAFWKLRGGGSSVRFWGHITLLIALLQFPIYNYIPAQIQILMIVAALAWRESLTDPRAAPVPQSFRSRLPIRREPAMLPTS